MSNSCTDNETWSKKLVKYLNAYTEQSRIVRTGDPSAPTMLIELESILEDYSDPFICSLHTKSLDESFRSKLEALKQHISSLECSSQKPILPSAPVTQDARMRTIRSLNNILCNKIMDSLQCFGVPILIIEFEGDAFVRQAMQRGLSSGGEGQWSVYLPGTDPDNSPMARRLWLNLYQDAASRPNSGWKYLREEHVGKVASLLCASAEGGPDILDAAVALMHACSLAHEIHNDRDYYKDGWESGYPTIDELENSSRNLYELYKWDACDTVDDRIWDLVWIEREKIVYNMPLSTNFEDLFEKPCVVNLSNIYQQQNRSFLAMLLVLLLSEYRVSKHADGGRGDGWSPTRLEHLLFIDRPQHVLGRKSPFGAQTQTNWQRAVDMLEDMVGQMRQCGGGLYVP